MRSNFGANNDGATLRFGRNACLEGNATMSADTVKLGMGSTITNVAANQLLGHVTPPNTTHVTLPLVSPFCELPVLDCSAVPPENQEILVGRDQQLLLQPGIYGNIRILNGGVLTVLGGEYRICGINGLKAGRASVIVSFGPGQSIINVRNNVTIGGNGEIITDNGAVPPELNVSGLSIRFGPMSTINAFITAPNALLRLGRSGALNGSFCVNVIGSDNGAVLACPSSDSTAHTCP